MTKRINYRWPRAALYFATGMMLAHVALKPAQPIVMIGRALWALAALWTIFAIVWNSWVDAPVMKHTPEDTP
jgi:drug/metabolite transporter superfamily protein YnfA